MENLNIVVIVNFSGEYVSMVALLGGWLNKGINGLHCVM